MHRFFSQWKILMIQIFDLILDDFSKETHPKYQLIHNQKTRLWELIPTEKYFDHLSNSLNYCLGKCMEISLENLYVNIM